MSFVEFMTGKLGELGLSEVELTGNDQVIVAAELDGYGAQIGFAVGGKTADGYPE